MRGRDVHDACFRGQQIHDQALVIDGYTDDLRAERAEQARRRHVPGVLDRDTVAGLEQDPGDQVDGVLGAAGDDDRVFPGRHRSRPGHPAGDCPPQPDPPGWVAVLPRLGGDGGGDPAAPHRRREQRGIRKARPEIEAVAVRGRPEIRRPAREPGAGAKGGRRTPPPLAVPGTRMPPRCRRRRVPPRSPRPSGGHTQSSPYAGTHRAHRPAGGSGRADLRAAGGPRK